MDLPDEPPAVAASEAVATFFTRRLDKTVVWPKARWFSLVVLLALYVLRVYMLKGFFVVTYGLGIYLLNLFIGFLSPAVDPDADDMVLPMTTKDEFRPFERKISEYKFWQAAFRATLFSVIMTCFQMFDLPVFWPILLAYFLLLVTITMKDRVRHMIKHRYVPFSVGKKKQYGEIGKTAAPDSAGEGDDDDDDGW